MAIASPHGFPPRQRYAQSGRSGNTNRVQSPAESLLWRGMLTSLLVFLCNVSPPLRRMLWRWWYSKLARQIATERWTFMNYGFAPADGTGMNLTLESGDEPDRLCIQLYELVSRAANLNGTDVLEVGSGRGGGASYLARAHRPAHMTGVDFSPQAVAFCTERHKDAANLKFLVGDAEALPFPDASFDAVVNVESSHCYGDVGRFFSEVRRVLRPGGWFLFADLRSDKDGSALEATLRQQPWQSVEKEEISKGVLKALELDDVRKRTMIEQIIPPRLRPLFEEFAGLTGSKVYRGLQSGDLVYLRFASRK
jgi:SAM-dependent methyltransferase